MTAISSIVRFILVAGTNLNGDNSCLVLHSCSRQLYFEIHRQVMFLMTSCTFSLLYGTEIMTYAEIVPNWFLFKLKLVQLT